MTMPMDPFMQAEPQEAPQSAAAEWTAALNDPKVRASMMSVGLQLMQPPQFGQTFAGQFAQGVGQAGEALGRQEEMDRAESEQARKERDTSSQIETRSEGLDVKRAQADAATMRADATRVQAESMAGLRAAQAQVALANVGRIGAQVQLLEAKVAAAPQDQAAKMELARARTELLQAQAGLAGARATSQPEVAASQVRRNDAAAGLSTARTAATGERLELDRLRMQQRDRALSTQEKITLQRLEGMERRDYTTEKTKAQETHRKEQSMLPRARQTPFSFTPFEEWTKTRRPAEPGAAAPADTNTPPVAPAATTSPSSVNLDQEKAQAVRALQGKPPELQAKIRALYKQRTGQDLP